MAKKKIKKGKGKADDKASAAGSPEEVRPASSSSSSHGGGGGGGGGGGAGTMVVRRTNGGGDGDDGGGAKSSNDDGGASRNVTTVTVMHRGVDGEIVGVRAHSPAGGAEIVSARELERAAAAAGGLGGLTVADAESALQRIGQNLFLAETLQARTES